MFELSNLLYTLAGVGAGTVAGLVPGVGVLASLLIFYPFIYQAEIAHLLLFYVGLAATVQFTGTIPSILLGVPGENNSIPAVIEGNKFRRHNQSAMAIGICAIGSVFGSFIAVGLFLILTSYALDSFGIVVSNRFRAVLYLFVLACLLVMYNNRNLFKNILLLGMGMFFGLIGESHVTTQFHFTFGIQDLEQGLNVLPVVSGLLVIPIVLSTMPFIDVSRINFHAKFLQPLNAFTKNISSSVRGSILGIIGGLVPGVSTILATNLSHTVEKIIHPNKPVNKIIAAETANNSGQFASLIPLLLLGIPITGSEVLLFNMLTYAGWDISSVSLAENTQAMIQQILPWFVFVNAIALAISWPLAKHSLMIFKLPNLLLTLGIIVILVIVNFYIGYQEYRISSFILQLIFFSIVGYLFRRWEIIPMLFGFLLASELEAVFYREILFL